jgi:hypothetical protein
LFYQKLKQGMTGLKNKSAEARGDKGSKLSEGKEPMPFELYRALCKWLIEDGSSESMFGHCFLTLTWNLMCRSRNTVYIRLEHMGWENDAMTIQFAHTKTDRAGEDAGHKRHIYANPEMPEICPILSLGRYRLSFPGMDRGLLFSGASQYDRFRKLLKRVVTEHGDEIQRLGVDPDEIGVHSIRKGAATYCCNGTPAGVSFPAVCIRAGWSMGNVKDRYLHHALAGDRVCGRTVTGLDVNSHKFSISPPHFLVRQVAQNTITTSDLEAHSGCIETDVDDGILHSFGTVPKEWRVLSWYLLASLLFHRADMMTDMKQGTRFRGTVLFRRGLFDNLVCCTRTCFPWENENHPLWRMTFTGIPQAVTDFNYHKENAVAMRALPGVIADKLVEILDE